MKNSSFTEGSILKPLMKFAVPVIFALVLQSLYGAVDLMVVGRFSTSAEVSAVATGSQIMHTLTQVVAGLSMGTTILIGQQLGEGKPRDAGRTVGASIAFFTVFGIMMSVLVGLNASGISALMNAPVEAFTQTASYVRICGFGLIFITAYNLLGSLFRGLGNSQLPLLSVAIAAVINIFLDLLFVAGFGLGAMGAALATVISQTCSVLVSLVIIRRISLPFQFEKKDIRFDGKIIRRVVGFGAPLALADLLVGLSFLIIGAIVNSLGVIASAGVGVAEKVCSFIMLVPSAFSQSMAAFVAQNYGAGKMDRARKGLAYGIGISLIAGLSMAWLSFFHGDILCALFASDEQVILSGWEYLKAYSIDCILTPFFFCMTGYFNGCGSTTFVMSQNLFGAVGVRVPVSFLMSKIQPVSLFRIGLATPCSSFVQCILCLGYLVLQMKKEKTKRVVNP
ncbi:MAG: MATE family efflux transporter [Bulleidia sp.]